MANKATRIRPWTKEPCLSPTPWLRTIPDEAAFLRPRVYGGDEATSVSTVHRVQLKSVDCRGLAWTTGGDGC
jgi:hypothetical protein